MIGIDTVQISRMRKLLENEAFKSKVFTVEEMRYCENKPDPAQSYAGIFCAKEAAVKALESGFGRGVMPLDIEISHKALGEPFIIAHGHAVSGFTGYDIYVSISHDGDYAVAAVYLIKNNTSGV